MPEKTKTTRKKANYIDRKELLAETLLSIEKGEMTDKLATMLMKLTQHYAQKYTWVGYTYNSDMQAYALMMLVKTWKAFNVKKSTNAFAFFTQCIKNSFIQILNQERRQRDIRDSLLVNQGMNPSHTYATTQEEQEKQEREFADDEENYYTSEKTNQQYTTSDDLVDI